MPVLGLVIIFSTAAHAGTGSGKIALGYLATSGNSDTTNLNAQIGLQYLTGKWTDTLDLAAIKSAESGESTAERYNADGKVEYDFTEKNYVFDEAQYTKDLFGGIRQRISDTVGYGRRILNSPTQSLDLQVGAGVRHETTQKPELKRTTDPIGTGQLDYHWQITKNSEFSETAKTEGGESNVFMESVTALKLRIYQNFFAQFSYTVDHNTQVPAGLKKTDTYTAISLSYEFGKQNQEG
jgi:putative salt-induced outer membrane protein